MSLARIRTQNLAHPRRTSLTVGYQGGQNIDDMIQHWMSICTEGEGGGGGRGGSLTLDIQFLPFIFNYTLPPPPSPPPHVSTSPPTFVFLFFSFFFFSSPNPKLVSSWVAKWAKTLDCSIHGSGIELKPGQLPVVDPGQMK